MDVRGFGPGSRLDRPLQAHTCKPGGADELFLVNHPAAGQLSMPAYDLCLEAEGNVVFVRACSDSDAQRFKVGSDGTVRTGDGYLCLSVAPVKASRRVEFPTFAATSCWWTVPKREDTWPAGFCPAAIPPMHSRRQPD